MIHQLRTVSTQGRKATGTLTLCTEDTSGWFYVANGVETGSTLADGVVADLHTESVLVVVDAGLIVEALFP